MPDTFDRDAAAGAQAALDMVAALYPGYDRQALDSLFRAMQDKYGSPAAQIDRAVRMAHGVRLPAEPASGKQCVICGKLHPGGTAACSYHDRWKQPPSDGERERLAQDAGASP